MNHPPGPVEKALTSSQRHGQSLRAVNEKLADLVASLRDQQKRLVEFSHSGAPPASRGEAPVASDLPQRTMAAELALACEALEHRRQQEERIRARLAEIQEENRRLCDDYVAVQKQNSDLASLYAAVERLHGAAERPEVLAAIQEIVVDMVGSEELALFELTPDGRRLAPAHAFGIDPDDLREIEVGAATVGQAAASAGPSSRGRRRRAARRNPRTSRPGSRSSSAARSPARSPSTGSSPTSAG